MLCLSKESERTHDGYINPIFTLEDSVSGSQNKKDGEQKPAAVLSSLCFVGGGSSSSICDGVVVSHDNSAQCDYSSGNDSSCDEDFYLGHSRSLLRDLSVRPLDFSSEFSSNRTLLSAYSDGQSLLWDLGRRKVIQKQPLKNRGQSLLVRRTDGNGRFIYQTRDELGTVSLHCTDYFSCDPLDRTEIQQFYTRSRTFCTAHPCRGDENLVVLPGETPELFSVRDWRVSSSSSPVLVSTCNGAVSTDDPVVRQSGMITSLSMAVLGTLGHLVACAVDAGSIFYHDIRMNRRPVSISLGDTPVLSLDIFPSKLPKETRCDASSLSIAGFAGDTADLLSKSVEHRGTVALVKTTLFENYMKTCTRAKLQTCEVSDRSKGKPGVNLCRFRDDGRLFAVGGWDRRLRIFDRRTSGQVAILRAHTSSVNAFDWAPDSRETGLLATGSEEGKIHLWRCFAEQ